MFKLQPPIKDFKWFGCVGQLFGVNKDYYYNHYSLPGHNGIDICGDNEIQGYGTPILATHNGMVSKVRIESEWNTKGNGIYILDYDGEFSTVYWHLSEVQVKPGQWVKAGDVIGLMGNTGQVYPQPDKNHPYAGTHLHFAVLKMGHNNQYRGFIDPTPILYNNGEKLWMSFGRNLMLGNGGDDVSWLQTCLKIFGYAKDYEPIGYFGRKTMRDVIQLQKDFNINPPLGFFGQKTRQFITNRLTI